MVGMCIERCIASIMSLLTHASCIISIVCVINILQEAHWENPIIGRFDELRQCSHAYLLQLDQSIMGGLYCHWFEVLCVKKFKCY